jgi:hypothetical protein
MYEYVAWFFRNLSRKFNPEYHISMNRQRLLPTLMALLIMLGLAPASSKLVKTKITNDITVGLPPEMHPMTPEDIAQRFPSVRAPLGAFTTEDRRTDFSVSVSATQWPDENLEMSKSFFKAGIINLYDKVDFVNEGIVENNKRKFIVFEFESRTNGEKRQLGSADAVLKYTQIRYLIQSRRTLVFAFNCPKELRSTWEKTASDMMSSIKVD